MIYKISKMGNETICTKIYKKTSKNNFCHKNNVSL